MVESISKRMRITEMSLEVFEKFLEYLYTGTVQLTPSVALYLYTMGDKFLMEDLKRLCLQFLWTILDSSCIVQLLCQAHDIGVEPKFMNLLLSYAAGHIGEISQEDFNLLTPDLVLSVLQCGSLSAREADILNLVCSWAKQIVERDLMLQSTLLLQAFWRRYSAAKSQREATSGDTGPEALEATESATTAAHSDDEVMADNGGGAAPPQSPPASPPCANIPPLPPLQNVDGSCIGTYNDTVRLADDQPTDLCNAESSSSSTLKVALSCGDEDRDRAWQDVPSAINSAMSTKFNVSPEPEAPPFNSCSDCTNFDESAVDSPRSRMMQKLKRRKLNMLRGLLAQPLRHIRFSLVNQKDLTKLAEKSKIRIITDAVNGDKFAPETLAGGGRRTSSSMVQLTMLLQRERTEKNFEYNGFKFKVVLVKSDTSLGVYLHFQYYTYPHLFVINAQGITISLISVHDENKKKTRVLDNKIGLGRFGLGYKAFITASEFPEYVSHHNEARVEVDFPFYNGRKLRLCVPIEEMALPPAPGISLHHGQ
uniref:BTB domain-containing protein n=1 Tax=Eutreptiella gymnastica TaxID=73025 RepID=A0A7S4GI26_9EUGL